MHIYDNVCARTRSKSYLDIAAQECEDSPSQGQMHRLVIIGTVAGTDYARNDTHDRTTDRVKADI